MQEELKYSQGDYIYIEIPGKVRYVGRLMANPMEMNKDYGVIFKFDHIQVFIMQPQGNKMMTALLPINDTAGITTEGMQLEVKTPYLIGKIDKNSSLGHDLTSAITGVDVAPAAKPIIIAR